MQDFDAMLSTLHEKYVIKQDAAISPQDLPDLKIEIEALEKAMQGYTQSLSKESLEKLSLS